MDVVIHPGDNFVPHCGIGGTHSSTGHIESAADQYFLLGSHFQLVFLVLWKMGIGGEPRGIVGQ